MTILIVPGVGGSEPTHWQSWLETQLPDTRRIEQTHWDQPVLHTWRQPLDQALLDAEEPVWIVAHSFGCLVTMSALFSRVLANKVAGVLLVAPASPERFTLKGFAPGVRGTVAETEIGGAHPPALLSRILPRAPLGLPIRLIASRTDPWLSFEDASFWATRWGAKLIDLGDVGHINVASGFGAWPQVISEIHALQRSSLAVRQLAVRHGVAPKPAAKAGAHAAPDTAPHTAIPAAASATIEGLLHEAYPQSNQSTSGQPAANTPAFIEADQHSLLERFKQQHIKQRGVS